MGMAIFAACSSNPNAEQKEEEKRDSIDQVVEDENEKKVREMERQEEIQDSIDKANKVAADTMATETKVQ